MKGNILLILGWLGLLAFLAAGLLGYGAFLQEALRVHVLVGLCACLLLLFAHSWMVIYALGVARAARRWQLRDGGAEALAHEAAAWSRRTLLAGALAVGAGLASFALGSASLARAAPAGLHHGVFYLALAAQAWALRVERRALAASDRLVTAADRRLAGHAA
jgi:hypothetical protein